MSDTQTTRLYPGAVYELKAINAMHDAMMDSLVFIHRPLPARRVFASYWRVLDIDGFREARNRMIQFYWPTKMADAAELAMYQTAGYKPPTVEPEALSPYQLPRVTEDMRLSCCGGHYPEHETACGEYLTREQLIEAREILMKNERPFVAQDRLSPYRRDTIYPSDTADPPTKP
jgi:hypothetical protein